jgi:two-component system, chemotaxis family, sensor kinase CheA
MDDLNTIVLSYYQEADELLGEIEQTILELEDNPEDRELINKLFRAVHTIKGSGAMFGFGEIADFSHHLETTLGKVRDGELAVTKDLINLVLQSVDFINSLLSCNKTGQAIETENMESIISGLNELYDEKMIISKDKTPEATVPNNGCMKKKNTYRINFAPGKRIFMNGTDPALLLEELRGLGETDIVPHLDGIPGLEELDAEGCYLSWDIIITTTTEINEIKDVFIFVENGSEVSIDLIDEEVGLDDEYQPKRLGEILIDRKAVSFEEINNVLQKQKRIGEMLVDSKMVDKKIIDSALVEQKHLKKVLDKKNDEKNASTIRVASEKLDILVDLVGELVTVQARLSQFSSIHGDSNLQSIAEEVENLTAELRDNTMNIRMMPIGATFSNFKRLVRDLSSELGKEIDLMTEGAETELDKTVIERLGDPLMHLIRNSIDHGIESPERREEAGKPSKGTISLKAEHKGAHVVITVNDDGAGLNAEAIRAKAIEKKLITGDENLSEKEIFALIFAPGFSTAERVSNVSGRGVGMDVARKGIEALRGVIELNSKKNVGTTVTIQLPLTLVIVEGLLVQIGESQFILPLSIVEECVELSREDELKSHGRDMANIRGELVPYIKLRKEFDIKGEAPPLQQIVVTGFDDSRIGFVVDKVVGEHQTVIKSLGRLYKDVQGISGATILGDGNVALIVDAQKIFNEVEAAETIN